MFDMPRAEFEQAVADAIDELPDEVLALLDNVVIVCEDDAPEDDPELLGYFDGIAMTERWGNWEAGALPNRIVVFRNPTLAICETREDVLDEVQITVVHEVAHFFGIAEERLHELGWG